MLDCDPSVHLLLPSVKSLQQVESVDCAKCDEVAMLSTCSELSLADRIVVLCDRVTIIIELQCEGADRAL